jgi:HAD superfamily hydrolase (TIGR01484 family)
MPTPTLAAAHPQLRQLTSHPKVLLTDFDGTLTGGSDGKLSPAVFARLWELKAQGVMVVVCTGRSVSWGQMIAYAWPVEAVICENGAFLIHGGETVACFAGGDVSVY